MNVITRLALSRIRTRKARSFVICTAIFLTAVLFMTVVSISANIIDSYTQIMFLDWGTDYHSYLLTDAFTLTPEELRDKIAESKYVKEAVLVCADNDAALYARVGEDHIPYTKAEWRVYPYRHSSEDG
jgi:predicted neutral ceramidase superfamily lipid hydrolase